MKTTVIIASVVTVATVCTLYFAMIKRRPTVENFQDVDAFRKFISDGCASATIGKFPLSHVLDGQAYNASARWSAEFGVFSGKTLMMMRKSLPANMMVVGFDTFTGLPDDWRPGYPSGFFDLKGMPSVFPNNTYIAKGLFQDTLPPFKAMIGDAPLGILHIDCDIYSGAAFVLETLASNIVAGTVIVFDEFHNYEGYEQHEFKAFFEFVTKHKRRFEVIAVERADTEQLAVRML